MNLVSILLYLLIIYSPPLTLEHDLIASPANTVSSENMVPPWWLNLIDCETDWGTTVCCCGGNGYICEIPGAMFTCYPGGSFECSRDLGICQDNPDNCVQCCGYYTPCA